ncbi:MAG: SGNH/GDSL hydrolase family protein [Deltaproteobacteria bacterium]|nr:SGNH/GDSL hydrolase family protein [Deltaproteobacteria bacterium]
MKRALFAALAAAVVFFVAEIALRIAGFTAPAPVWDYRLRISGELYGEPDPDLFWRLPNRKPDFRGPGLHVVCLADSVTVMDHGEGYPEDLPAAFAAAGFAEPVSVFNAGVPEYTAYQGRVYLEKELLGHDPNLVTVQFGVNDHWPAPGGVSDPDVRMPPMGRIALHRFLMRARVYQALRTMAAPRPVPEERKPPRVQPEAYVANLRRIVELSRAQNARVIFVVSPYLDRGWPWMAQHREYQQLTRETGARLSVPVVDVADRFLHAPELFLDPERDPIHFNREGGRIIARAIAETAIGMDGGT